MNIKERLIQFIKYLKLENKAFEKSVCLSNGFVNNAGDSIRKKSLDQIKAVYPILNLNWLITGVGDMLEGEIEVITPIGERTSNMHKNVKRKAGLIPFYNADFIAGNAELYYEDSNIYPEYYLDVPEFSGCTAFRAFSDSMEKIIRSGSTLFGSNIQDWKSHLEFGQIYGITCKDGRRYLKYIRKDKENPNTHFLLRSENDDYDDFTLPIEKIKNIWLIEGWINKTT